MKTVIASTNMHKISEFRSMLAETNIEIISQDQLQIPKAKETGLTFVENAIIKARNASQYANMPAIADDSGLEVTALANRPGIYSARFAGINSSSEDNINKLLQELNGVQELERIARFQCVIVFLKAATDPTPIICQGTWEGRIVSNKKGTNGFGYDPIFFVPDYNCTAAELPSELKNKISHRGQALQELCLKMGKIFSEK